MADYLYNVPRNVLTTMLQSESRAKGFSDPGVRVSLLLDVDAGKPRSQREYATLWGWSHKKVRLAWETIVADVEEMATAGGRQKKTPLSERFAAFMEEQETLSKRLSERRNAGAQQGHSRGTDRGTENGLNGAEKADQGHTRGTDRGTGGAQHTIQPSNPTSPKGEREGATPACARPSSLDECREYFDSRGSPEYAEPFFDFYTSKGWLVGKTPMKDWRAAARGWIHRQHERDGTHTQTAGGSAARRLGGTHPNGSRPERGEARDDPAAAHARLYDIALAANAGR